ncbi:hypothetical protein B0I35DRAFT_414653 [Stachybotrys elegans]|uniref:LysM domain-containing protein n=1 Tax=Stachybotrys elegans TaxID=80388 RepID=A0A8K0SHR3_9HYPO|nr:hypothetical protein B0I35DRAFT_414653 [Stachybotrys elegans]
MPFFNIGEFCESTHDFCTVDFRFQHANKFRYYIAIERITIDQLYAWNSGVGPQCRGLWSEVWPGTTCNAALSENGITLAQLYTWNTGVGADCSGITSTATTGNEIATPSPTQPGVVNDCDKFDFVEPDQSCTDVLKANSSSLAQLYAWNRGEWDNNNNDNDDTNHDHFSVQYHYWKRYCHTDTDTARDGE